MYTPDRWVVLEISSEEHGTFQRVFAGWYGGFANGDSWKMNSGITQVVDEGEYYDFHGESGSVYRCYKRAYGMSNYMHSIFNSFQKDIEESGADATITIVPEYENAHIR